MKSIFKKIALVLALAMVVTMMPAKTAAAADGPQMSSSVKLYIGGDFTESYTDSAYAKVWNKDGYTVAFSSSNEDVATVGAKKGLVTAVGVGEAVITAVFTAEDGTEVEKTCTVYVKKNAVEAGISAASAKTLAEGIEAGTEFQTKAYRTDADGVTTWKGKDVITDAARFESSNEEVFTVTRTTGKITAVAEGEAVLSVWAVQYDKQTLTATTDVVEYPVKVVVSEPVVTGANVTAVDTLVLDVAGVDKDNVGALKIFNVSGGDITALFADPVLSEDGKTVTLKKYMNLANDEKLTFTFSDVEEGFEYTVKVGNPTAIIIDGPVNAVVAAATDIKYRVVDENGIDLKITNNVTFTLSDNTYAFIDNAQKITMYQSGRTVTLTATYNTGKYDENWAEIKLTSQPFEVVCVDQAATTVSAAKFQAAAGFDSSKATADPLSMFMQDTSFNLYAVMVLSNNSTVDSFANPSNFTFEALTPSVLLVDNTGRLAPVATGTAKILVTYDNGVVKSSAVATVYVKANPYIASVSAENNGSTVSSALSVAETVNINLKGKDQYGGDYTNFTATVVSLSRPNGVSDADAVSYLNFAGGATATFAGAGKTAGTYTYRVTVADNVSVIVSVTVRTPEATIASYKVIPSTTNIEIDPANFTATTGTFTFKVVSLDRNGVAIDVISLGDVTELAVKRGNDAVTVAGDTVNVFANVATSGAELVLAGNDGFNVTTGTITITGKVNNRTIIPANITVSVKKSAPVYTATTATLSSTASGYKSAIAALFDTTDSRKASFGSVELGDIVTPITDNTASGTSFVLVKTIKVYENVNGNMVLHTIDVNKYFSVTITGK